MGEGRSAGWMRAWSPASQGRGRHTLGPTWGERGAGHVARCSTARPHAPSFRRCPPAVVVGRALRLSCSSSPQTGRSAGCASRQQPGGDSRRRTDSSRSTRPCARVCFDAGPCAHASSAPFSRAGRHAQPRIGAMRASQPQGDWRPKPWPALALRPRASGPLVRAERAMRDGKHGAGSRPKSALGTACRRMMSSPITASVLVAQPSRRRRAPASHGWRRCSVSARRPIVRGRAARARAGR